MDLPKRLHVIVPDAVMSHIQMWLALSVFSMVLSLAENHMLPYFRFEFESSGGRLPQIVSEMHAVSYDTQNLGRTPLITIGGRKKSALELQQFYYELASKHLRKASYATEAARRETLEALDLWGDVLEILEAGNLAGLVGTLDWATLMVFGQALSRRQNKKDFGKIMAAADLKYHFVPMPGEASIAKHISRGSTLFTDEQLMHARSTPPQRTRARLRGECVQAVMKNAYMCARGVGLGWDGLEVGGVMFNIPDVRQFDVPGFDVFIGKLS